LHSGTGLTWTPAGPALDALAQLRIKPQVEIMAATLRNGQFFGNAGRSLSVDDVVLTETSYENGFKVPAHAHSHPFFCVPLEGAFTESFDRTRRLMRPRSAFYHPPALDHSEQFEHGCARLFNMQLGGGWLSRLAAFDITLPDEHVPLRTGRVPVLALQLHQEYLLDGERLVVDGLLLAMIGELNKWRRTRERGGRPGWLQDVVAALRTGAPTAPGLAELAVLAQVHPAHLARTFRSVYGCTIGEYTRTLRIARARDLLGSSPLAIAAIAAECGFADQSHLTRVFRREVGVTPAAYRRVIRTGVERGSTAE
jgi:AraC family transcriptional regulator